MPDPANVRDFGTAGRQRSTEDELDYALNQLRVARAQLQAAGSNGNGHPRKARRQRLHAWLDRLQSVTPEFARALVRRYYLEYFYYKLYPQHSQEAIAVEPTPPVVANLAHSGYAPFLAFKQNLCRSIPMEFADIGTPSESGLISVILPVYNGGAYLPLAIDSALRQTYRNFELVVIDDGSTDSTPQILERYAAEPRVRVYRQPNRKLPAALNAGFERARGEFFTWISADNVMHPEMLATLWAFLSSRTDIEMVYADEDLIDDRGLPACGTDFNPGYQTPPGSNVLRRPQDPGELNFIQNNYIGACFLYRAWAGRIVGNYDTDCFGFEDYDYWMRMNALFRISHLGDTRVLYSYRLHDQSLSAREKELRISERARYFLPLEAERRRFFSDGFDIDLVGNHAWFDELVSIYRRSGHNARCIQPGRNGRYVQDVTRAFEKRIVIATEDSPEAFAVLTDGTARGKDFEIQGQSPAALAWPILAAANARLWKRDRHDRCG